MPWSLYYFSPHQTLFVLSRSLQCRNNKINCFLFRCSIDATLSLSLSFFIFLSLLPLINVTLSPVPSFLFLPSLSLTDSLFISLCLSLTVYGHGGSAWLWGGDLAEQSRRVFFRGCSFMQSTFVHYMAKSMWTPNLLIWQPGLSLAEHWRLVMMWWVLARRQLLATVFILLRERR